MHKTGKMLCTLAASLKLLITLLLLLPATFAVQPSDTLDSTSLGTLDASHTPSTFYPPQRTLTPDFPSLHVMFVVGTSTYTHIAAPVEYLLELKRRGHRVSWQQPQYLASWFKSEQERLSLPFNFSLVDVDNSWLDGALQRMSERPWLEVISETFKKMYPVTYPVLYRALLDAIKQDRPDVLMCDSLADHCVDVSKQLQLPAVITHCTTPFDTHQPYHFDVPWSFTSFSQQWHEQPLWHRLYNTFAIPPLVLWHGVGGLRRRIDEIKAAAGSPGRANKGASTHGLDVLYDSSWAWEWPLYLPPYLHMVGPIPKTWRQGSQQLDPSLQRWLDDSVEAGVPVVYVAMGSIAKLMDGWLRTFTSAFSSCPALPSGLDATNHTSPFRVLWADRNSPPWLAELLPPSVRVEGWVDQPAVLAHPAVHLFLSHGGMGSSQEALAVGLPILALPILIDQPPISAKLRDRGVAVVLDKMSFTADEMCAAMRHLVFDPQVRQSADMLQRLYHKSDSGGLQRAADIIERAAVSTKHLIPYRERQDVSWVVRYNVDVYAIGLAVLAGVLGTVGVLAWLAVQSASRVVGANRPKSKLA